MLTPPIEEEPGPDVVLGDESCSELECTATTGVHCEYIDRRDRHCPTAWCPQHRRVLHRAVYCAVHAETVGLIEHEFGTGYHPDLDNRMPALIGWVAKAVEDDIVSMLLGACQVLDQTLVSDPVHFVLVGVERTRTWERAWKTVSPIGMGCRVAICLEERRPDTVQVRVLSQPVTEFEAPWGMLGVDPTPEAMDALFRDLEMPVGRAVHEWQEAQLKELEGGPQARWQARKPASD